MKNLKEDICGTVAIGKLRPKFRKVITLSFFSWEGGEDVNSGVDWRGEDLEYSSLFSTRKSSVNQQ